MQISLIKRSVLMMVGALLLLHLRTPAMAADASLSWDANTENDLAGYKVYYGTSSGNYGAPVDVGNQTSYTVTGLNGSPYYFAVRAYNTSGTESGYSNEVSKSFGDTTAPSLSAIAAGSITSSGTTITWSTNESATSRVEYGPTTAYGSLSTLNATLLTSHSTTLTSLQPATTYNYRVISRDAAGNTATSGNNTFTTAAAQPPSETAGPVLSAIGAQAITTKGVTITWGTDESATSEVEYGLSAAYGNSTGVNATLSNSHSRILSGLQPNTVYHYRVKSADVMGNLSVSADHTFTTNPLGDTIPPADVENFTATPGTQTVTLSWVNPSDSDFIGVRIAYRTDRFPNGLDDGEILGDFSGRTDESITVIHAGLQENVTYYYSASSYDNNGNYQQTAHASATPFGFSTGGSNVDEGGSGGGGGGGGCAMVFPTSGTSAGPGRSADVIGLLLVVSLALLRKGVKRLTGGHHHRLIKYGFLTEVRYVDLPIDLGPRLLYLREGLIENFRSKRVLE